MATPQTPEQNIAQKWATRKAYYDSQGVDPSIYSQLMQQDIANVAQNKKALTREQVGLAINSALTNKPTITTNQNQSHGLLGDLYQGIKNIGPDMISTVKDIPIGLAHEVAGGIENLIHGRVDPVGAVEGAGVGAGLGAGFFGVGAVPGAIGGAIAGALTPTGHKTGDLTRNFTDPTALKKEGFEVNSDPGAILRNISSTLGGFVPGVHTLANLTSPQGRTNILQHPTLTAIDVAPVADEIGGAMGAADIAAGRVDYAPDSIQGAFKSGNSLKALSRSVLRSPDLLADIPHLPELASKGLKSISIEDRLNGLAKKIGWDEQSQGLLSGVARLGRKYAPEAVKLANETDSAISEYVANNVSEEAVSEVINNSRTAGGKVLNRRKAVQSIVDNVLNRINDATNAESLTPAEQALKTQLKGIHERFLNMVESDGNAGTVIRYGDVVQYYENNHPVVKMWRKWKRAEEGVNAAKKFTKKDAAVADNAARRIKTLEDAQNETIKKANADFKAGKINENELNKVVKKLQTEHRKVIEPLKKKQAEAAADRADLENDFNKKVAQAAKAKQAFEDEFRNSPPSAFHRTLRNRLAATLSQDFKIGDVNDSTYKNLADSFINDKIAAGATREEAEAQFDALLKDTLSTWHDLAKAGLDPLVVMERPLPETVEANVLSGRANNYAPSPGRSWTPSAIIHHAFDFRTAPSSISVALTETARDYIRWKATIDHWDNYVAPLGKTVKEVEAEAADVAKETPVYGEGGTRVRSKAAQDYIAKNYEPYVKTGNGTWTKAQGESEDAVYIPKHISKLMDQLYAQDGLMPGKGVWDSLMKLFKTTTLFGPRHLAHVGFGGLVMLSLQDAPALSKLLEGWKIMGPKFESELKTLLSQPFNDFSIGDIHDYSAAKSLGARIRESVKNAAQSFTHFEEAVGNTYRMAEILQRMEERGVSPENILKPENRMLLDEALNHANKVFVNMDAITPLERRVIKQFAPFYAFTKHLLQYAFMYPFDHPARAAVLEAMSRQFKEEWNKENPGLPDKFYNSLLFSYKGGTIGTDIKNVNPFRSLSNIFGYAGIVSGLNPALQDFIGGLGINTLGAIPELYPKTTVNPATGRIEAVRPGLDINQVAQSLTPVLGAVEGIPSLPIPWVNSVFKQSADLKKLAETNPNAFYRKMYSNVNMPFVSGPIDTNYEKAKSQISTLTQAGKDATAAIASGNFDPIKKYNLVPFKGQLVTPQQLEKIRNIIHAPSGQNPLATVTNAQVKSIIQQVIGNG